MNSTNSSSSDFGDVEEENKIKIEGKNSVQLYISKEDDLENYTNNHFLMKLNDSYYNSETSQNDVIKSSFFDEFVDFRHNNSPVSMSNDGSCDENEPVENAESNGVERCKKYKKFSYSDVEKSIEKYYDDKSKYANVLDILITYLNGQKNLYIQAKNVTNFKLNMLIIPSLILSAGITVFAPFIQTYEWSAGLISAMNAAVVLLISLASYLRLESTTEMYLQIANQYDKLETSLCVTNNKFTYIQDNAEYDELVFNKIKDFEKRLRDIKGFCTLFIPEEVKRVFPIISHINIFSIIKKIEHYKRELIIKLKDAKNEVHYIMYKILHSSDKDPRKSNRLGYLFDVKEKIKDEIIQCQRAYGDIDEIFIREINVAEKNKWLLLPIFVHKPVAKYNTGNTVLDKHLTFMFSD